MKEDCPCCGKRLWTRFQEKSVADYKADMTPRSKVRDWIDELSSDLEKHPEAYELQWQIDILKRLYFSQENKK